MKLVPPDGLLPRLNEVLAGLFRAHGVEPVASGEWLAFPGHGRVANAQVVREIDNPNVLVVQLDVRLRGEGGVAVIESFAGWGPDLDAAVRHALEAFVAGTFHVLLAAFFGRPAGDHATQERETIGGRLRLVTLGNIVPLGRLPEIAPGQPDMGWFAAFMALLAAKPLPGGTHWVRLYYCQSRGQAVECEVLLDNEPWADLRSETARLAWPKTDEFYSVRVFLVIQDAPPTDG